LLRAPPPLLRPLTMTSYPPASYYYPYETPGHYPPESYYRGPSRAYGDRPPVRYSSEGQDSKDLPTDASPFPPSYQQPSSRAHGGRSSSPPPEASSRRLAPPPFYPQPYYYPPPYYPDDTNDIADSEERGPSESFSHPGYYPPKPYGSSARYPHPYSPPVDDRYSWWHSHYSEASWDHADTGPKYPPSSFAYSYPHHFPPSHSSYFGGDRIPSAQGYDPNPNMASHASHFPSPSYHGRQLLRPPPPQELEYGDVEQIGDDERSIRSKGKEVDHESRDDTKIKNESSNVADDDDAGHDDGDPLSLLAKVSSDQSEVPNKNEIRHVEQTTRAKVMVLSRHAETADTYGNEHFKNEPRDERGEMNLTGVPQPITPLAKLAPSKAHSHAMTAQTDSKHRGFSEFTNYAPPPRHVPASHPPHSEHQLSTISRSALESEAPYPPPPVVVEHGSFDSHVSVGSSNRGGHMASSRLVRSHRPSNSTASAEFAPPHISHYPSSSSPSAPSGPGFPYRHIYGPPPSYWWPPRPSTGESYEEERQWGHRQSAELRSSETPHRPPAVFTPPRSQQPTTQSNNPRIAFSTSSKPTYSPKLMFPRPATLATSSYHYGYSSIPYGPPSPHYCNPAAVGLPHSAAAVAAGPPEKTLLRKKFSWKHFPEVCRFRLLMMCRH
jgi:hypothetical protein